MRLPDLLAPGRHNSAVATLACYYGLGVHGQHAPFTGAWFDTWDSSGSRESDVNRFTADDLIAVSFLSVQVPPLAAAALLDTRAAEFTSLLEGVGPDRDLAHERAPWLHDWAGWELWAALMSLPGVGATIASKLYARKRPRLRPIYDSVVAQVIGDTNIWEPMRALLQERRDLHATLLGLREEAALPDVVSALRVFDVVAWMEGKGNVVCRSTTD